MILLYYIKNTNYTYTFIYKGGQFMEFQIKPNYNEEEKRWDIDIYGEIDIYNSSNVKDYLSNLIQVHQVDIHMNCENLEYIDSTGLGALVAVVKKVKLYNGNIYIKNVKKNVEKVIKITNLDKVFILESGETNA